MTSLGYLIISLIGVTFRYSLVLAASIQCVYLSGLYKVGFHFVTCEAQGFEAAWNTFQSQVQIQVQTTIPELTHVFILNIFAGLAVAI